MKNTFLKSSCLILLVVVAFVYFANPIYAKASTPDMDYIETDMSTADVKALFSGAAAFIPAAFVIIGFIALMYCTLRNVNTPVQFSSSDSFIDKCRSLGQYCVDNCTDSLKNVLYSVYEYCEDNNITSITGFGTFLALNIGKFISAFSAWINGSLINDVSQVGAGLVNQFNDLAFTPIQYYPNNIESYFSASSGISLAYKPFVCFNNAGAVNYIDAYSINTSFDYTGLYLCLTPTNAYFYRLNGSVLTRDYSHEYFLYYWSSWNASDITVLPSSNLNVRSESRSSIIYNNNTGSDYYFSTSFVYDVLELAHLVNVPVLSFDTSASSYDLSDGNVVVESDVVSPSSDLVYVPQAPAIPIDLVGTWSDLADALAHGGDVADVTQEEKIAAYVPADVALQLDSAVSDTINVIGGGNYVFPSLKGVWKYAEYFFNTLKGWGQFVGGCLNAVTVGEGGLSWLFYGGFIILVCGGVVGKILLG